LVNITYLYHNAQDKKHKTDLIYANRWKNVTTAVKLRYFEPQWQLYTSPVLAFNSSAFWQQDIYAVPWVFGTSSDHWHTILTSDKSFLGRPSRRLENNIKMDLTEICRKIRTHTPQNRDKWRAVWNTAINKMCGKFLY